MPYKDIKKKRECQRRVVGETRREYFVDKYCEECGSLERLNLHHLDPSKKISHRMWSWSPLKREEELKKCTILCESCHQMEHNPRRVKHGSLGMYKDHKCRCELCRRANAEYERGRKSSIKRRAEERV